MELLLALAGAVVAFLAGWRLGRPRPEVDVQRPAGEAAVVEQPSYTQILDQDAAGFVLVDPAGRQVFENIAYRAWAGTHIGVLVGEAVERHAELARRSSLSEDVIELYGPPRTFVDVRATLLASGYVAVFVDDISERRRLDQMRTDFVANVSHELKTPIGALSVLAETLLDEPDPDTIERVVERMMGEAQRASRTIEDLLELSRIELGGEQLAEPVRVADVVRTGVERVVELAKQHEIGIVSLDPVDAGGERSAQLVVRGDRRQLISAVGNLVENAVKYSPSGSSVTVRVGRSETHVDISISDEGIGIPQRDLDRIFERFYRVDRARSRVTGGTGLGLSIVRHIATNHDGEVLVESAEGEGSTFVLRLPLAVDEADREHDNTHDEGVA